ncbi:hypothetical protein B0H63DRAFT_18792 [Podospora didyma]|uniref:Uncharacterized protein n=1 Tax=Podospora didyma TaxID=330526 RepID=A0AAE0P574_9PEZI|nr:hypothetical protein B0H63DRAFT_18792 [Podospora didyma]
MLHSRVSGHPEGLADTQQRVLPRRECFDNESVQILTNMCAVDQSALATGKGAGMVHYGERRIGDARRETIETDAEFPLSDCRKFNDDDTQRSSYRLAVGEYPGSEAKNCFVVCDFMLLKPDKNFCSTLSSSPYPISPKLGTKCMSLASRQIATSPPTQRGRRPCGTPPSHPGTTHGSQNWKSKALNCLFKCRMAILFCSGGRFAIRNDPFSRSKESLIGSRASAYPPTYTLFGSLGDGEEVCMFGPMSLVASTSMVRGWNSSCEHGERVILVLYI